MSKNKIEGKQEEFNQEEWDKYLEIGRAERERKFLEVVAEVAKPLVKENIQNIRANSSKHSSTNEITPPKIK